MNTALVFDMQTIATQSQAAEDTEPSLVDRLLGSVFDSSSSEVAEELSERAADYQATQSSYAEDLRAAAKSVEEAVSAA